MGLGKSLKKAVKSVSKAVSKVASNPIVKLGATAVASFYGGPAAGALVGGALGAAGGGGVSGGLMGALGGYAGGTAMNAAGYGNTTGNIFSNLKLSDLGGLFGGASSGGSMAPADVISRAGGSGVINSATGGGSSGSGGLLSNLGGLGSLLGMGANAAGGYLQGEASLEAAKKFADAQTQAAQIAADAAKFRPVGVMSRFGSSQFATDANGNLVAAGYTLNPETAAMQNVLMQQAGNYLDQYKGAQAATAPMGQAAQSMMTLGNQYLGTSPQAQAQKYMQEQQALLASGRATDMATLQAQLQAQGRGGLAVGGDAGMLAANPEMNAYYNSLRQQDLGLAAQATQGGMDYAKFGAGMVGGGGDMLSSMYGTQSKALDPYNTALGGATYLEGLGQQTMDQGINIGAKGTAANAQSGLLLSQGVQNSASAMQQANQYSPWGNLLSGFGNAMTQQYGQPQNRSFA